MPDSARQNAQHAAPAPLEEFENGLLEKKQKREHGGAAYAGMRGLFFVCFWVYIVRYQWGLGGNTR